MTVKALQKQLIAAVAMVLVAVIAVSGSTFAWFAQNTKVTASEVTVTAQSAKNLSISDAEAGTYATSMTLANPNEGKDGTEGKEYVRYWPVSATENSKFIGKTASATLNAQDGVTFYTIKADNKVNSADAYGATTAMSDATLADSATLAANFTEDTTGANFWTDDIWLRYDYIDGETTAINATVVINIGDENLAAKDITKALHVAFATEAKAWVMGEVATATANSSGDYEATLTFNNLVTLTANTPQLIKAYIWYEGEDTDCFTNSALAPKLPTTTFSFEIPTV